MRHTWPRKPSRVFLVATPKKSLVWEKKSKRHRCVGSSEWVLAIVYSVEVAGRRSSKCWKRNSWLLFCSCLYPEGQFFRTAFQVLFRPKASSLELCEVFPGLVVLSFLVAEIVGYIKKSIGLINHYIVPLVYSKHWQSTRVSHPKGLLLLLPHKFAGPIIIHLQ